jgi:hypothetical protein
MEWWILLGLASAVVAVRVVNRLRKRRRRPAEGETGSIYPLW